MIKPSRHSALHSRHVSLGADLNVWNGMLTPWRYQSDGELEHDAVRTTAGLFDMSAIKKIRVTGPDAVSVIQHVVTRDVSCLAEGRSTYSAVLNDNGYVCDDAIVFNDGENRWLFCHGAGESMERLIESGIGREVQIALDDTLHCLMLQGPMALDILRPIVTIELEMLKYFHHVETEVLGHPCVVSRTSYSGERGYEIFADQCVVCEIWDGILEHGARDGVVACSFETLNIVRVEAGLLFYGYDMTGIQSPWEVGLGFTVSTGPNTFRGKHAALSLRGNERFVLAGIVVDHPGPLAGGETLLQDSEPVGIVNSPVWSHRMEKSLALVHLAPEHAMPDTVLGVAGQGVHCQGVVARIPFYDPDKTRVRA